MEIRSKALYKIFYIFLSLVFVQPVFAQLASYEIGGYTKYLFSSTSVPQIESRLNTHLIHSRLNTRWYPNQTITAALELRFRAFYGDEVEKIPGYKDLIKRDYKLSNLDAFLWEDERTLGYLQVDRLWLDLYFGDLQITTGRQRIAWGTSWVWNPTDIFNPLSVLDFDYEELPAVDALRAQYYFGPFPKIDLAVEPGKTFNDSKIALLLGLNKWDYDFNFLTSYVEDNWMAGFSWVGDILDAGFRGEIILKDRIENENSVIVNPTTPFSNSEDLILTFVLSGDYTFPNSFYIHTEVLFNNNGKTDSTALFLTDARENGFLTAARWSVYHEFAYNITPLSRGMIFTIINPDDKSFIIVPSFSYSLFQNIDLYLTAFFSSGDELSEYGTLGNSYFLRLKYSY